MERSFTTPFNSLPGGPTARPYASSLFSGSGRRNSAFNSNAGFARKGSGRYSLSSRSNISTLQVVAKSEYNVLECYGLPLPVQVTEILTFNERNVPISINYSQNGWAWLVQGRLLLVWQYRDSYSKAALMAGATGEGMPTPRRTLAGQCRQLTLPHCDIGHKAGLVTVFVSEGHQMASCLAVSPAGDVRYWQSIAHDGSSVDECNILEGQEFEQLIGLSGQSFVLATTTCSLVRLQIFLQNGRYTIAPRVLKPPSGFLGGIGKKFASIIIGMHSIQERENKLVKICSEKVSGGEWHVTVLADRWIQRWSVQMQPGNERFLCEDSEIMKKMREYYQQKLWNTRDISEVEMWALDMQSTDRGVIILSAAVNTQRTPQVYYALMTFLYEGDTFVMKETTVMKYKGFYSSDNEQEILDFKFIANRNVAYVYNDRWVMPVFLSTTGGSSTNSENGSPSEEVEKIEFNMREDNILAGNCFQNTPLFFTRLHGMVVVTPSDFDPSDVFNSSISSEIFNPNVSVNDSTFIQQSIFAPATTNAGNLVLYDLDPEEICTVYKDPVNQLKAAFIYHIKRNTVAADEIISSLLQTFDQREVDGELDRTVLEIAIDLADDTPAADPRWEVTNKNALGSSTSMQIIQQLREKNIAFGQFIEFLRSRGLWDRLNALSNNDNVRPTALYLSDVAEKIVATIGLRCVHSSHARIVEEAIELVLQQANRTIPFPNLTAQDLFYAQTSKMEEIFKVLGDMIESYVKLEFTSVQVQTALVEVNNIVLTLLQEVMKFRDLKAEQFGIREELSSKFEYVPWTASSGRYGLKDVLLHMIANTLRYGVKGSGEAEYKIKHFKSMTELIDYVLDGRKKYLETVRDEGKYSVLLQQYESQRSDLIYPLVEAAQYELAAKLAEKYLDFQVLVQICDRTNNQARLDEYIERYKEHDFSQFAISWHMRENKQGDIFQRFKGNQAALARFLTDHPSLAWIQLVFNGELSQAAEVLLSLAQNEKELLSRKRIMLSLSKLCALAAEGDFQSQISEINSEARLMDLQEQIPLEILNIYGYDTKNAKVLSPEEIVDLYIADEYSNTSEAEFRNALELLTFVAEPMEVRHKIWCAAILRDSWEDYNKNSPMETMQNMMFFRLIDLCYMMNSDLENFLPPLESFLTAPELGALIESKSFQYLLKLGYEHICDSYRKK